MGKTWDTEKVEKFIDSFSRAYDRYTDDLHLLEDGMSKYYFNDTYRGQAAVASKNFIEDGQSKLHVKQIEIQRRLVNKYYEMLGTFKDKVDSSSMARIDTDLLQDIKKSFKVYDNVIDAEGYDIESKARYIADKFGRFNGNLIPPSYRMVSEMYEDFSGSGGLFDQCIRKLEEFDEEMCRDIDQSGIEEDVDSLQDKIVSTASILDSMQVSVENMPKFSLGLNALKVSSNDALYQKKYKKAVKDIYIAKLLGKLNENRFIGTYEKIFYVKDSNRVRIGTVDKKFITVTGVYDSQGNLTTGYGGAQAWFMNDAGLGPKLSDFGCGSVASVNQYLYLTGQTTISYDEYKKLVYDFVDAKDQSVDRQGAESFGRKQALKRIDGFTPEQMTGYVTNMCASKGVTVTTHWDYVQGYEADYQSMKEQLNKGVPVIWAIHDFENSGKEYNDSTRVGVDFYIYNELTGKYSVSGKPVTSHYVTATAIYEDADDTGKIRRLVEISSWGQKFYVDYDQYVDLVIDDSHNEPFSSITHTTVK